MAFRRGPYEGHRSTNREVARRGDNRSASNGNGTIARAAPQEPRPSGDYLRAPRVHSDFQWPRFWITDRTRAEIVRRYDSGESWNSIVDELTSDDRARRMECEGALYEARPQRLIAPKVSIAILRLGF